MIITRWNMPTALTTPIYETPTIYVNAQRIIISRQNNSQLYTDKLNGTAGADVIVGTIGKDNGGLAQQVYVPAVSSRTPYAELAGAAIAGCSC